MMLPLILTLLVLIVIVNRLSINKKITEETDANDTRNVEVMVPLKYLSNFWRTVEILLLICEINLILTWSLKCVIASNIAANQATTVVITDTKLYIPIVTLSTQDNAKLLQQIKSGFNRTIYWNKYQSKVSIQAPNIYLGYLIDPGFQ